MVTHCALSAQHIQKFAKSDPFVYVGDFNIKPDSSMYALLTQGTIEKKVRASHSALCSFGRYQRCLAAYCLQSHLIISIHLLS